MMLGEGGDPLAVEPFATWGAVLQARLADWANQWRAIASIERCVGGRASMASRPSAQMTLLKPPALVVSVQLYSPRAYIIDVQKSAVWIGGASFSIPAQNDDENKDEQNKPMSTNVALM